MIRHETSHICETPEACDDFGCAFDEIQRRANDYEAAAEYVAEHFGNCAGAGTAECLAMVVTASVLLKPHVAEDIDADPSAFQQRVRDYLYGMAMENDPRPLFRSDPP